MKEIQTIRNHTGRLLGRLFEDSNPDNQLIQNEHGGVIGRYIKSSNITFDASGRQVGKGNLLLTLIH